MFLIFLLYYIFFYFLFLFSLFCTFTDTFFGMILLSLIKVLLILCLEKVMKPVDFYPSKVLSGTCKGLYLLIDGDSAEVYQISIDVYSGFVNF